MSGAVEEIRPGVFSVTPDSDGIIPILTNIKVEIDNAPMRSGMSDLVADALISWHRSKKR